MEDGYYLLQVTPPFHEFLLEKRKKIMEQGAPRRLGETGRFYMKNKNQINCDFLIEEEENRPEITKYEMTFRAGQKKVTNGFVACDVISSISLGSGAEGQGNVASTVVEVRKHEWLRGIGDLVVHPDQRERTLDLFNKKVGELNAVPGTETLNPVSSDDEEPVMKNVDQRNLELLLKKKGKSKKNIFKGNFENQTTRKKKSGVSRKWKPKSKKS